MTPIKFLDGSPITESMATPLPPPPEQTAATGKRLTSGLMQTLAHLNLSRVIQGFAAFLVILLWGTTLYEIRAERHLAITTSYRDSANLARAFEEHTIRTLKSVDQAVLFLKFFYENYCY